MTTAPTEGAPSGPRPIIEPAPEHLPALFAAQWYVDARHADRMVAEHTLANILGALRRRARPHDRGASPARSDH